MSAANERSLGEQLVRIIRDEIREYDRRKERAAELRRIADEAVAKADRAADAARNLTPDPLANALVGDANAKAIDALLRGRQHQQHVHFNVGGNKAVREVDQQIEVQAARAEIRTQQQAAEKAKG